MKITVFTPTYNRAYIIEKLYNSLLEQTFTDFEWIVVDDGSTDNTEELFEGILYNENLFEIRYLKVENGGKHRAINKGIEMASGEMFFIVDSDDYLPADALMQIANTERTIPEEQKSGFAGVCGIKAYTPEIWVGSTFHGSEYLDITSLEREKYQISGDKAEVFYTDVLRKYPFPEFEGERFLSEAVVWDRIANDGYKLRFFNHPIYICDYLPDGLSANCGEHFEKSPRGYALYITQSIAFGKLRGLKKWEQVRSYYNQFSGKLRKKEIANNLRMNGLCLAVRMFFMRVFYKLYR